MSETLKMRDFKVKSSKWEILKFVVNLSNLVKVKGKVKFPKQISPI